MHHLRVGQGRGVEVRVGTLKVKSSVEVEKGSLRSQMVQKVVTRKKHTDF